MSYTWVVGWGRMISLGGTTLKSWIINDSDIIMELSLCIGNRFCLRLLFEKYYSLGHIKMWQIDQNGLSVNCISLSDVHTDYREQSHSKQGFKGICIYQFFVHYSYCGEYLNATLLNTKMWSILSKVMLNKSVIDDNVIFLEHLLCVVCFKTE